MRQQVLAGLHGRAELRRAGIGTLDRESVEDQQGAAGVRAGRRVAEVNAALAVRVQALHQFSQRHGQIR